MVVLAKPLDEVGKGQFKVTQVLHGNGVKPGETISLPGSEEISEFFPLPELSIVTDDLPKTPTPSQPAAPLRRARLFLVRDPRTGRLAPLRSGLRLGMAPGEALAPRQLQNPGPYCMVIQEGRVWENVVKEARETAAAVEEVLQLKAATGKERVAGLLRWIECHRLEFGGGFFDGERAGWGSLETDVFAWICEQEVQPEDCWAAIRLYAELNRGATLPLKRPSFGTQAGRAFLLGIALSEQVLDGDGDSSP